MELRYKLMQIIKDLGPFASDGHVRVVLDGFVATHRCQWDTEWMMRILGEANGI